MEWSLDRFGHQTTKLRSFEAVGTLETTATAKAPKGSSGLPKQKCLGSPLEGQHRRAAKNSKEYYRGGWSPSPLPSVLV